MALILKFILIMSVFYFVLIPNSLQSTEETHDFYKLSNSLNEQSLNQREIENNNNLFLKIFVNSNCIEIESRYNYSGIGLNVVEHLFALNFSVILERNPDELCRSLLVLVGANASKDFQVDFQHEADERSTVALMVESEEIRFWLLEIASEDETFDIFGFSDAFLFTNGGVYQLSTPESVNRRFSVITEDTLRTSKPKHKRLPNFEKKLFRVSTFNCPVGVFMKTIENQTVIDDGLEYTLFVEIARRLNFSYEFRQVIDESNKWGKMMDNGSWDGGIVGSIFNTQQLPLEKRIDVGFCGVWKVYPQSLFVDLTTSIIQEKNLFLVRQKSEVLWSWMSPYTEFQPTVWLFIAALFLLQAIVLNTAALISKQCPEFQLRRYFRFSSCLMEVLGIHVLASSPTWKRKSTYLLMIQLYSLVITTSYTSYILNRLLTPHVSEGMKTVKELTEGDYFWGKPYLPSGYVINYKPEHVPFMKRRRLLNVRRINQLIGHDDRFALLVGTIMESLIKNDISVNVTLLQRRGYRAVPDPLQVYNIAFALRRHSPYTPAFDQVIARISRSGLLFYWINDLAAKHRDEVLSVRRGNFDDSSSFKALTMQNLKGAIALLIILLALSTCVFIVEILHFKYWDSD